MFLKTLKNFCLEIYELDYARFITTVVLVCYGRLKKSKVKLDMLIDMDMLLIIEKGTRGVECECMKNYNKNIMKASMYLKYCDVNDSYG